ncbi:hypothetical protein [Microlunatus soli]|uniref:Uncharacterized protein n=1 Tax=Microlunatus soli TaxID=630515 RepID=A0A1H1Z671_9ACTN|nr:hypothetical protein [Microlunatus soli]SDT29200.1 hypothetical protein SAMN04489812_5009 [Microlunatus soli]
MSATTSRPVLLVGFDPTTVPNVDAEQVNTALRIGRDRFAGSGLEPTECLVSLDESAVGEITAALAERAYDCVVVVGGGIRKPEPLLELFETVVNLIRRHAPQAVIAFNSNPTDSCDAAQRAMANAAD